MKAPSKRFWNALIFSLLMTPIYWISSMWAWYYLGGKTMLFVYDMASPTWVSICLFAFPFTFFCDYINQGKPTYEQWMKDRK